MRKQLLKDSATYLGGSIIVQILSFIGMIFLMRFLPVSEYGKYTYIIEFISIFAFFSDGGFTQHIIKESSQNPGSVDKIYARAQSAQLLISGLMLTLILCISYPTNSIQDFYYLFVFGLSVVISAYFAPMLAILVASGRKDLIFYKDVSLSLIRIFFILLGIYLKASFSYFIYLGFINAIVLLILFLYIRRQGEFKRILNFKPAIAESIGFIRHGILFTILMAANVIYNKIDIIMLEKMIGSTEVGYYSGATRFIYPFMFISGAFMTAIFPKLAKHSEEKDKFKSIQNLALYYLGGIGVILSTSLYLGSDLIFQLFFSDKYDASIPVFKILVWYLAIVFIYGPISNSLVAKNKVVFLVYLNLIMIVLNVAMNFFLIPVYGAKGAAMATITCEILILISAMIYWKGIEPR
ncbi:MAG TPA: flippase [Daejeonella sp.]|uniref:flippase n=1 Tax=Daejeonella sp. TaxID=2805397 RepID=UPI002ED96875